MALVPMALSCYAVRVYFARAGRGRCDATSSGLAGYQAASGWRLLGELAVVDRAAWMVHCCRPRRFGIAFLGRDGENSSCRFSRQASSAGSGYFCLDGWATSSWPRRHSAIRAHYGRQAWIAGVMYPYQRDVLAGTDWLDEQWYFDPRGKSALGDHLRIWRKLLAARFDMVLLMPNSPRSAILSWLGRAKRRIGYARYGRGPLLTDPIRLSHSRRRTADRPMVDYYLHLAEVAGCPSSSPRLELATTPRDERMPTGCFSSWGCRATAA